ncbi:sulfonate transport system ATP-binding protein [Paenibacillus sophorae]|uniref:Sulfonate transport system ATP-binding protein n=2 Tax=Paenibacillus sophorae TaxID=1333845 RepID=A0A1H8M9Z3_9BACL|nr:ATP-binding cassette domain-containing protein [Paenibacillus sophorae]SEO14207.1 sulfonate transport system ATP-binding protein [Paenibacillus sophorae]
MERTVQGASLQTEGLEKKFGDVSVLKGMELTVEPGEFIAVVGKSGCGKSTLLRLIAGLERPTSGTARLDGKPVSGIDPQARVLFQESRLLPWKRVIENVRLGATGRDRDRALEALRLVGLEARAQDWPGVLSGGQQQRVALARAIAGQPRLLLLDEPFGALDALTRLDMQKLIERLWAEQHFTVLLVTHDVSEAVALADRVILVEDGRITMDERIALGRPRLRDSGFAHYENVILKRVMNVTDDTVYPKTKEFQYSI